MTNKPIFGDDIEYLNWYRRQLRDNKGLTLTESAHLDRLEKHYDRKSYDKIYEGIPGHVCYKQECINCAKQLSTLDLLDIIRERLDGVN